MVSQARRNSRARPPSGLPSLSGVRSRRGTSLRVAARGAVGMSGPPSIRSLSRTDDAVEGALHPEDHATLNRVDDHVQADPHDREDDQDREDAGHVHVEVALQYEIAEPGLGADELAHDRADDREHDGDVEAVEDG